MSKPVDLRFREHGPVGGGGRPTADQPKRKMPEDVGFISDPRNGRRYLFETNGLDVGLLVPQEEIERGIEEELHKRFGPVRRSAEATSDQSESASEEAASYKHARKLEEDRLERAALENAEFEKLIVKVSHPQLPGGPGKTELPDLVEWVRGDDREDPTTSSAADEVGGRKTFQCFPHHVLTCEEYPEWGPGRPVRRLPKFDPVVRGDAGKGLTVAVIDTGGWIDHNLLHGEASSRGDVDGEDLDENDDNTMDFVAGHGTFIAGIIRQYAPGAKIVMRSAARPNGTTRDGMVAGALLSLLDEPKIDYINLSLGGYLHNNNAVGLQLTIAALHRLRAKWRDLTVVAAAGNNNREEEFFPAALDDVIGVGALGADGKKADFSNFGDWVDKWELGVDLESSWVGQNLATLGGSGIGNEGAIWSGTSFAAPMHVAALAAAKSPGS